MITSKTVISDFLGLMTHLDETNVPLGGAIQVQNFAQYVPQRIQRIPGLTNVETIADSSHGFLDAWHVRIDGGAEKLMAVIKKSDDTIKVWNITDGAEVTGSTLTDVVSGQLAGIWSSTYYLRRQYVANGTQPIQIISTASTRTSITATTERHDSPGGAYAGGTTYDVDDVVSYSGSNYVCILATTGNLPTNTTYWTPWISWVPPIGSLVKSYLGSLFVAGIASPQDDVVWYSDPLTTDFEPTNFLNIDEIPGKVLAMAISSATTADTGILGELIFAKQSGLVKLSGHPLDTTNSRKDVISSVIGSVSPHTFCSTPIGLFFLGIKNGIYSMYFLQIGSVGEPQDIGLSLRNLLNDPTYPIQNPVTCRATFHDGMLKLFLQKNNANIEIWGDITGFIRDGKIRWYGPHTRGANQSPCVSEAGLLHLFEVSGNTGYHFTENTDKTQNFYNLTHTILPAVLDIPLNIPPISITGSPVVSPVIPTALEGIDKSYDTFNVYFSKETNVVGNALDYRLFTEGIQLGGVITATLNKLQSLVGIDKHFPIVGVNGASFFSRYTVRVQFTHNLDFRCDISHMGIQFLYDEQPTHKSSPNG